MIERSMYITLHCSTLTAIKGNYFRVWMKIMLLQALMDE